MFLAVLSWSLREDKLTDGSVRKVLKFPVFLAPIKLAVLPLVKKDGLPEYAKKIFDDLKLNYSSQYDEKDAIGRRYRRQDAVGTPFCITIDYTTLDDDTVTLRDRDQMKQERITLASLKNILDEKLSLRNWLKTINF
jgi:glycyl-tRNA synthetase